MVPLTGERNHCKYVLDVKYITTLELLFANYGPATGERNHCTSVLEGIKYDTRA